MGYRKLLEWLQAFGTISVVAVEGTSSYDAGLTRTLQAAGVSVVEVDRPNRQVRRRQGKSDALDAIAAARSVLAGTALGAPKTKGENVQGIRVLAVVRQTATKATTQALNQIQSLVSTAPERPARAAPSTHDHPDHRDLRCPPTRASSDVKTVSKVALRILARQAQHQDTELEALDERRTTLVRELAPT